MPLNFVCQGGCRLLVAVLVAAGPGCSSHSAGNQDGGGGGGGSGGGGVAGGVCGNGDGYHDVNDKACWTSHDAPGVASSGATFDGRYIYFPSSNATGSPAVQYDTQGSFSDSASWISYDFTGGNGIASTIDCSVYARGSKCLNDGWGPAYNCSFEGCDGNTLVVCGTLSTARIDCGALGGHCGIDTRRGQIEDCIPDATECNSTSPDRCNGTSIEICINGKYQSFGCTSIGLPTCSTVIGRAAEPAARPNSSK